MLHAAPPHFRPDVAYAPGYDAQARRGGQRRAAEAIATRYGLSRHRMADARARSRLLRAPGARPRPSRNWSTRSPATRASNRSRRCTPSRCWNTTIRCIRSSRARSAGIWRRSTALQRAGGCAWPKSTPRSTPAIRTCRARGARSRLRGAPAGAGEAHGTAVAGIIAARADDRIGIAGVAPDSELYALRACRQPPDRPTGTCTTFTLAMALQFALDRNAQVVNMSLGGPRDVCSSDCSTSRSHAMSSWSPPSIRGRRRRLSRSASRRAGRGRRECCECAVGSAPRAGSRRADHRARKNVGASSPALPSPPPTFRACRAAPGAGTRNGRRGDPPRARVGGARGFRGGRPRAVNACTAIAQTTSACVCGCRRRARRDSPTAR